MSDQIEKIDNVEFEITDEVLNRKWIDVISKRNKLLSISDWTQLADVDIPPNIRNLWRRWRQKIREIKRTTVTSPDKALSLLNNLEKQMPKKIVDADITVDLPNQSNDVISINELKQQIEDQLKSTYVPKIISLDDVKVLLDDRINAAVENVMRHTDQLMDKKLVSRNVFKLADDVELAKVEVLNHLNATCDNKIPTINSDLLNEAIDCISTPTMKSFPILSVHAHHHKLTLDEMAAKIIEQKKNAIKLICKTEQYKLEYTVKINSATSQEELMALYIEISNGH
jgi:hypothetical protein